MLDFQIPLGEPDVPYYGIRLSELQKGVTAPERGQEPF
jgi:hypothetical protein